jgi:hypothetical protein
MRRNGWQRCFKLARSYETSFWRRLHPREGALTDERSM